MKSKIAAVALVGFLGKAVQAVPSPSSLGSDLQILLHNDLYGNESSRTDAVIVLGTPQTKSAAASDCAALGEQLWTPPADLNNNNFLTYLAYQNGSAAPSQPGHWGSWKEKRGYPPQFGPPSHGPPGGSWGPPGHDGPPGGFPGGWGPPGAGQQQYFIASMGPGGACQAITPTGQVGIVNCNAVLPALCTQSAQLSDINNTNTSAALQTEVTSGNATFIGYRDLLSFRFLGMRYGTYPKRFTYSSVYNATGTVSALQFGNICRQIDAITNVNDGDEDCLMANVYTPSLPNPQDKNPKLKPVMLWIHGGGYNNGYGSDPTFDGGNLASRGDVVVVTINYRLNDFGYLVLNNTGEPTNGNYGKYIGVYGVVALRLSDQVTALAWVQANIKAFGGDPSQVTIFGQSAGAGSVRALLSSPPAAGLFSAAILQSSLSLTSYTHYLSTDQEIIMQTNTILNKTGCASGDGAAELACLRAYNASGLLTIGTTASQVVVDGTYITSNESSFNGTGHVNKVPLLIGNMRDDGAPFFTYRGSTNLTAVVAGAGIPVAPVLSSGAFPVPNSGNASLDVYNVTAEAVTDDWFRCEDYATAYSAVTTNTLPEVYYYEFNRSYQIPYWPPAPDKALCNAPITPSHPAGDPNGEYFKCHSGELMIVFSTWRRWGLPSRDQDDTPFDQFIVDSWTSWARSHDPTPDAAYLAARGYVNTTLEMQLSGSKWAPVTAAAQTERWLQWPSAQIGFGHADQCSALGQPLNYFLSGM